jgi:hypothetical protein
MCGSCCKFLEKKFQITLICKINIFRVATLTLTSKSKFTFKINTNQEMMALTKIKETG